ncbi:MAG TPA: FAD-binding oxidoreductase [Candidatus Eisenbacteria bacterium]
MPTDALHGLHLSGTTCLPGEPDYEEARTIWNAMVDRRPAAIVRAVETADVMQAVAFAREHGLRLAVRGGGHNIAGHAVCDGGLMLDLSLMKAVRVDPTTATARIGPGATLGEFDREAQAFCLATPLGINSTTGVAGLTLGGGFGWISRKHGLTVDNLLSVDVVTPDGTLRHASEQENVDLFWAVRGGGGNFGVVTSFEYRLHPVGPEVIAGLIVHPFEQAKGLLEDYRIFAASAPDEVTAWVVLRKAPPLPFLPAEVHGKEVLVFAVCAIGDKQKAEEAIAPLRAMGRPIADVVGRSPFVGWQKAFDPLLTAGARNYWKSHSFMDLDDGFISVLLDAVGRLPGTESEIFIAHLGGAIHRIPADATAYPHRDVNFIMNLHTRWRESAQDSECIARTRQLFDATAPFATGAVYVNFMPDDETQRVQQGAYGTNYERLAQLKKQYDPTNLLRMNQNIEPAA